MPLDLDHHQRPAREAHDTLVPHPLVVVHALDRDELAAGAAAPPRLASHPFEEIERGPRRLRRGEELRAGTSPARELGGVARVVQDRGKRARDVGRIQRIEQDGGVANHFRDARDARGRDRAADEHGLDQRDAEAFEQRGKDEARRARVEGRQVGAGHVAQHANESVEPVRLDRTIEGLLTFLSDTGEHQGELAAMRPAIVSQGFDQSLMVLVVPRVGRVQDVARGQRVSLAHGGNLDARALPVEVGASRLPDCRYGIGFAAVFFQDTSPRELRDGDDVVRGPTRFRVEVTPVTKLVWMKELRVVLVLDVVHGDHGGDRTDARVQVGERAEPQVEALVPDQIAQTLRPVLPVTIAHVREPRLERLHRRVYQRTERMSNARRDATPVHAPEPPENPVETIPEPCAPRLLHGPRRGFPREQHPPAPRRIRREAVVIVVRRHEHVLVIAQPGPFRQEVAEVHLRSAHLPGPHRDQVHADPHLSPPSSGPSRRTAARGGDVPSSFARLPRSSPPGAE